MIDIDLMKKDRSDFKNYDEAHVKEYLFYAKSWLNFSGIEKKMGTGNRVIWNALNRNIGFGIWKIHIFKFVCDETSYDPNATYTNIL